VTARAMLAALSSASTSGWMWNLKRRRAAVESCPRGVTRVIVNIYDAVGVFFAERVCLTECCDDLIVVRSLCRERRSQETGVGREARNLTREHLRLLLLPLSPRVGRRQVSWLGVAVQRTNHFRHKF
jgi:hypothetical protein